MVSAVNSLESAAGSSRSFPTTEESLIQSHVIKSTFIFRSFGETKSRIYRGSGLHRVGNS